MKYILTINSLLIFSHQKKYGALAAAALAADMSALASPCMASILSSL